MVLVLLTMVIYCVWTLWLCVCDTFPLVEVYGLVVSSKKISEREDVGVKKKENKRKEPYVFYCKLCLFCHACVTL